VTPGPFRSAVRTPRTPRRRRLRFAALTAGLLVLAGCGGGSATTAESSSASPSAAASASAEATVAAASAPVRTTAIGVSVTGDLGQKPKLTVPSGDAPKDLKVQVLVQGDGAVVAKGQTLVANYLGQTWSPKDGAVNVFDNSWDRSSPAAFPIGVGQVIKGWDDGLVGQKIGSRVLLSIPAALAYGQDASTGNELAGQSLLFVVDILGSLAADASATGTAAKDVPAGFPKVDSASGKQPKITSVSGVATDAARSTLLIKGSGEAIDPARYLALQFVQTDTATGKQTQGTWGQGAEVVAASAVLTVADALQGQNVGSRVLAVTKDEENSPSLVVVIDVIGQY